MDQLDAIWCHQTWIQHSVYFHLTPLAMESCITDSTWIWPPPPLSRLDWVTLPGASAHMNDLLCCPNRATVMHARWAPLELLCPLGYLLVLLLACLQCHSPYARTLAMPLIPLSFSDDRDRLPTSSHAPAFDLARARRDDESGLQPWTTSGGELCVKGSQPSSCTHLQLLLSPRPCTHRESGSSRFYNPKVEVICSFKLLSLSFFVWA